MPTYEYECRKCGHMFELSQAITAAPVKKCPKCQREAVKRLISGGAGFIFKGSGFYATDYKRPKTKDRLVPSKAEGRPKTDKGAPRCDMAGNKDECSSCPGAA